MTGKASRAVGRRSWRDGVIEGAIAGIEALVLL